MTQAEIRQYVVRSIACSDSIPRNKPLNENTWHDGYKSAMNAVLERIDADTSRDDLTEIRAKNAHLIETLKDARNWIEHSPGDLNQEPMVRKLNAAIDAYELK